MAKVEIKCRNCGEVNAASSYYCSGCNRNLHMEGASDRVGAPPASPALPELDLSGIVVSTADIRDNYEILDAIFAIDSSTAEFLSPVNPGAAFEGVKLQLKLRCAQLGGDAVVGCQFEYRNALKQGFLGSKQAIEIFAYGTAIKRKTLS